MRFFVILLLQVGLKCNIDGLAKGTPSLNACREFSKMLILFMLADFVLILALVVEMYASMITIEKSMENNWKNVWIETDCFLVNAFSNPSLVPSRIEFIWLNFLAFSQSIDFMVIHIYREVNACADSLANIGHKCKSFSWFSYVHNDITKDYLLDKIGTPRLRLFS